MKKILPGIIVCFLLVSCKSGEKTSIFDPVLRARRYLYKSLEEYRIAIKKNPGNKQLIEEYTGILKTVKGEIPAKIEFAILLREIGLDEESDKFLTEVLIKDSKGTKKYLDTRIEQAKDIPERILLYKLAVQCFPENGDYWYQLGRLYLGTNDISAGITALENAYGNGIREKNLFYYLAKSLINQGDYKKAEVYLDEGIKVAGETIELRRLRHTLYIKQKKTELAKLEERKIKQLLTKEEKEKGKQIVLPEISPYEFIYVAKNQQKLYLYRVDTSGLQILQTYPCSTGKNQGTKMEKGDGRTPEGTYLVMSKMEGTSLPPKYGIVAYPLNYPNIIDRRLGRDGNGIWLHGTPIERPPYNSEGCVVVGDNDLRELKEHITVRKTFVCIGENPLTPDYQAMKKAIETTNNWKEGWESLDIEKYMAFYDEMFYSGGRDKKEFRAYKERINKNKKHINVEISELQILPYGKTPLGNLQIAFFKQKYSSNNFSSTGYKLLYLVERSGRWLIIGEEMI